MTPIFNFSSIADLLSALQLLNHRHRRNSHHLRSSYDVSSEVSRESSVVGRQGQAPWQPTDKVRSMAIKERKDTPTNNFADCPGHDDDAVK